jgi:hypothetical protein
MRHHAADPSDTCARLWYNLARVEDGARWEYHLVDVMRPSGCLTSAHGMAGHARPSFHIPGAPPPLNPHSDRPRWPPSYHLSPITFRLRAPPASGIIVPRDTPLTNVRKMTVLFFNRRDCRGTQRGCNRR